MKEKINYNFLLILIAAMLWGTTGTAQSFAPNFASPLTIGAMRIIIGGIVLLFIAIVKKKKFQKYPIVPTFLSAFFIALYQLSFFLGVSKTGVAIGTMVAMGSAPIFAGILGFLINKEHLNKTWYLATFFAIIGAILLATSGEKKLNINLIGFLLSLTAGFSYASYTAGMKVLLNKFSSEEVSALAFCLAGLLISPVLFLYDMSWVLQTSGIIVSLHLGIFATGLSYFFFTKGLQTVQLGTSATLALAEPLTAFCLGIIVLGEKLKIFDFLGVLLIFVGLCIITAKSLSEK